MRYLVFIAATMLPIVTMLTINPPHRAGLHTDYQITSCDAGYVLYGAKTGVEGVCVKPLGEL